MSNSPLSQLIEFLTSDIVFFSVRISFLLLLFLMISSFHESLWFYPCQKFLLLVHPFFKNAACQGPNLMCVGLEDQMLLCGGICVKLSNEGQEKSKQTSRRSDY